MVKQKQVVIDLLVSVYIYTLSVSDKNNIPLYQDLYRDISRRNTFACSKEKKKTIQRVGTQANCSKLRGIKINFLWFWQARQKKMLGTPALQCISVGISIAARPHRRRQTQCRRISFLCLASTMSVDINRPCVLPLDTAPVTAWQDGLVRSDEFCFLFRISYW